jgi:ATP-dependent protease ClpP protease subunit
MKPKRDWYRIEAKASDPTVVDIYILDLIGDWVYDLWELGVTTAKSFVEQLSKLDASVSSIRVHINSPGGDVFSALTIANALRDQRVSKGRTVVTIVDGLAASAASVVAMAGERVEMADNALLMIHNPYTYAVGNAAELQKAAETLNTIRDSLVATYQWHSTLDATEIAALLDAETWMTADEAIERGFATDKVEGLKAAALLDGRAVRALRIPDAHRDRVLALVATPEAVSHDPAQTEATASGAQTSQAAMPADVLRLCRASGCDLAFAQGLIDAQATLAQVEAATTRDATERAAESARSAEIRGLCATAKWPELADGYITGKTPVAVVRDHLVRMTAKLQAGEIDGSLQPDHGSRQRPRIDVAAVYAVRNGVKE